jgi:hypothetical protein
MNTSARRNLLILLINFNLIQNTKLVLLLQA